MQSVDPPGFACKEIEQVLKRCCEGKVLTKNEIREVSKDHRGVEVSGDTLNKCISQMIAEGKLRQTTKKICVSRELPAYEVLDPPKSPSFDWLLIGLLIGAIALNIGLLALKARRRVERLAELCLTCEG